MTPGTAGRRMAWGAVRRRSWGLLAVMVVGSAPLWLAVFGGPADPLTGFAAGGGATWPWHWEAFVALPLRLAQRVRGWLAGLELHPVVVNITLRSKDPVAALQAEIGRELERCPVVVADTFERYYHLSQVRARFVLSPCRAGAVVRPRTGRDAP